MDFGYSYWGPILIIAALVAYGIYVLFKTVKAYMAITKMRKKHLEETKENFEKISDALVWIVLYGAVAVLSVAGLGYGISIQDFVTTGTFGFLIVYSVTLALEVSCKRTIYFGETHFIFDQYCMKYRSIREVKETGKMIKTCEAYNMAQAEPIKLPRKYGHLLDKKVKEFKAANKRSLRR